MYLAKMRGGTEVVVQGLTCHLPAYGFGGHTETGEIEPVDVIKRSSDPKEQYWEAQKLPEDFEERVLIEAERQLDNPEYSDKSLDSIREREWHRRIYGVWFWNKGKPVYLTGLHYFFMNYWHIDDETLPDYRKVDLDYFYMFQHIQENPKSLGGIEVRKRRDGKSLRAGCIAYERASRNKSALCGIQSMNDKKAEEFFEKFIVIPFKNLPSFFIPIWDTSSGSTPKGSLRFFKPSVKGKKALANLRGEELKSKIDYRTAKPSAYDGEKTKFLVLDESGKVEHDVMLRHSVLKYCVMDNRMRIIGKMWVTSTVEEIGLNFRFKDLWDLSNQYDLSKDGSTNTGLSRIFIPADEAGDYDKYGEPFTEANRESILIDREKFKDDPDRLYAEMRKMPLNEKEAFMFATTDCHFNLGKINQRIWELSEMPNVTERGNFVWENGEKFTKAVWVKDNKGRFEICTGFKFDDEKDRNNVGLEYGMYVPKNQLKYVLGLDPYGTDDTEDYRRSMAAAMVLKKNNPMAPHDLYNKAFVCKYHGRPKTLNLMFEDIIKMAWYFGSPILFENNKSEIQRYFIREGLERFLIKLDYKEYGIPSTPDNKYTLLTVTEAYVEYDINKVYFIDLLENWKQFNIRKTQKYDLSMAAGWTLVEGVYKIKRMEDNDLQPLSYYGFKKHKTA